MRYVSVCSGIEAATVAWHPLGWTPLLFAEIAPFPSRVLAHHYPDVPNVGDFTQTPPVSSCDLLVGGTPCQAFSVAGLRGGLADARGNLALEFCRLADRLRARWVVWENVPGVLSSGGGRDFGSILGALGNLGYGFAYRVLDAQFFGVPQRRRRVFVVGYLGDYRRAAAVLFERASMRGDPPPRRGPGAEVAGALIAGLGRRGQDDNAGAARHVIAVDTTQVTSATGWSRPEPGDPCHPLAAQAHPPAIAFHHTQDPISSSSSFMPLGATTMGMGVAHCLAACAAKGGDPSTDNYVATTTRVRRLTPRECERLQGFPDDYTAIPGAKDAPRYRALGNSMAVPVTRWIGRRIAVVDAI